MVAGALAMLAATEVGCLTVPANVHEAFQPSAGSHFAGGGSHVNGAGGAPNTLAVTAPVPPVDTATPTVGASDAATRADGGVP